MLVNISQRFALIACLYVIHFNLSKSRQTMAEDKNETTPVVPECVPAIPPLVVDPTWLEKVVFGDFRIWHILFSGMAIFTGVTIVLCCLFRCRIPRTKQEIEADFLRKRITESFRSHLEKIKIDELQGQYDTGNLLPLFKKVELFEEDRLQKNEGFRKRKLTWRQKLKRLFTGKDSVEEYGDRSLDDSKGEGGEYTKMTEEEMETIEKEVEGAKTDTSALNMINDQIAIFGFIGESKKDRKKRIKEEKKAEKAAKKEQKAQEKLEKKLAKQQPRKSIAGSSSSARAKSAKALMELRPDSLEKDHLQWKEEQPEMRVSLENGGDSIVIDIEDRGDVILSPSLPPFPDTQPQETQESQADGKDYREFSLDIPEVAPAKKSSSFASRFSFRDTVSKLIHFGGKPKQKEELVINIGLVKKDDEMTPPMSPTIVSIPHIECSPPDSQDTGQEQASSEQQQAKRKAKKLVKKDSDMARDESQDRNLLQIPEISKSTKEINTDRKSKESKEKDGKKKKDDKRKEKEKEKSSKVKEKKVKIEKPSKADKQKEKAKAEILETTSHMEVEKTKKTKSKDKLAKPEKDDSSKKSLLKRQTGKEDGQVEKVKIHDSSETEKKDKKSKSKDHKEKFKDVCDKTQDKKLKKKQKDASPELPNLETDAKSKMKHKEGKPEHPKEESKKEKTKKKQLEFDDVSIEQTQMALRETKKGSSLKSDRQLETFPMVVEEVKSRQRKEKTESSSGRRLPVSDLPKTREHKEHPSPKRQHSSKPTASTSKSDDTPKLPKTATPKHIKDKDSGKQKDFNQMITSLNEELKEAVDQRRKKQLKRSKTIVEDGITPKLEEMPVSRPRSRDEFKKRLSEALLQRIPVKSDEKGPSSEKGGTAKPTSRHVRIVTKQGTSSSEIEIPVEHVYTQGSLGVIHLQSPSHQGEHLGTADEASTQLPVRISTPPALPSPTHSTISVTTDNIVKKLVESSPETGENRELTYERSRDVIFSVDQSFAHRDEPQPSTSSTTTSTSATAKPKRPEIKSMAESSAPQSPSESPSKRHRTKDKTKEKKGSHKDH